MTHAGCRETTETKVQKLLRSNGLKNLMQKYDCLQRIQDMFLDRILRVFMIISSIIVGIYGFNSFRQSLGISVKMNFIEKIFWKVRYRLVKNRIFLQGYAEVNKIRSWRKEDIVRHYFCSNPTFYDGKKPPEDLFFKEGYLLEYPEIAEAGIDPWIHYVMAGKKEGRDNGFNPSGGLFFKEGYLVEYPDVAESGINPWEHYVLTGRKEGRDNGFNPSGGLFFKEGYLVEYPDVAESGINPWEHYVLTGRKEGRDNGLHPSPEIFNAEIYRAVYSDLDSIEDLWVHYAVFGKKEKRSNGVFCGLISGILLSAS